MGVNTKTSKATIETITGIVGVERRHLELTARFAHNNNSHPEDHMSAIVRMRSRTFLKRRSCFALCTDHPILDEHEVLSEMYTHTQIQRNNADGTMRLAGQPKKWTINDSIIFTRAIHFEERRQETRFLQQLIIHDDCKPRAWYALGRLGKKDARLCLLLIL